VIVTHTSVSRLVLQDSLEGDSAQKLIQKVHRLFNSVVTTLVFSYKFTESKTLEQF